MNTPAPKSAERPKYAPPAGGPRMFGGPRPTEKSVSFGPSLRRLLGQLRSERPTLVVVVLLAICGILMSVVGPKILGRGTDIIFAGVVGQHLPPQLTKAQAIASLEASGQTTTANIVRRLDVVPGRGIDFDHLARGFDVGDRPLSDFCFCPVDAGLSAQRRGAKLDLRHAQ